MSASSTQTIGNMAWRAALLSILLLTFFPFIFMLMSSLKTTHQFYHSFWLPAWPPYFTNYSESIWEMRWYLFNSILVTGTSVGGIVLFSLLSGFLFARYDFPGREFLYYALLAMMMVPPVLMLIPSFAWVKQIDVWLKAGDVSLQDRLGTAPLGLKFIDTYWVMIFPYIAGGQILGVYLLRGFFAQIDQTLFEAAQVDGAGLFRELWHVAMPLAKPVIGVVAIMSALGVWNQFLWPLVTTSSDEVMVLTVGILRYNMQRAGAYGPMFAGFTISAIPLGILFLFATRMFMKGITSGALKA